MSEKAIKVLENLLKEEKIPYKYLDVDDGIFVGSQIIISKNDKVLCDVIQNNHSYGNEENLLEILGALTEEEMEEDVVLGFLTPEEVLKRFKYCYNNNTSIYKK